MDLLSHCDEARKLASDLRFDIGRYHSEDHVDRKYAKAAGLLDALADANRGAVEAERKRVAEYVRGRGADCWDPSVEAALRQVAGEIERDHHHGGR